MAWSRVTPYRPHESLGHPVLPRALVARPLGLEPQRLDLPERHPGGALAPSAISGSTLAATTAAEKIVSRSSTRYFERAPRVVEGERLSQLLYHPRRRGAVRDVPVDDLAPRMPDGEPDLQDAEGRRRHREEVHGTITSRWFRRNVSQLCLLTGGDREPVPTTRYTWPRRVDGRGRPRIATRPLTTSAAAAQFALRASILTWELKERDSCVCGPRSDGTPSASSATAKECGRE